jgi:HTH-type transcriptional regulator / antitoxin HigA
MCNVITHRHMDHIRHPGAILREKLEARGWTQDELVAITGKSRATIAKIIAGNVGISPEMAAVLAAAFGDVPEDWLKWSGQYELSLVDAPVDAIGKRAKIYSDLPIRDMQKRGWITLSADPVVLQAELENFVGPQSADSLAFPIAARKSDPLTELSPREKAWAFRARQLAAALPVVEFDPATIPSLVKKLRVLAAYPEEIKKLAQTLAIHGIKFVIVEPLAGARLDGATFWIGESPVIAMSARFDRNDNFWFTFFHEMAHVIARDAFSFDSHGTTDEESFSIGDAKAEAKANRFASETLIPNSEMESFIRRVAPLYQESRIVQFSNRVKMHPGVVLGQLHKRGEVSYGAHRKLIVKVRDLVIKTSLTDGWGNSISPKLINGNEASL